MANTFVVYHCKKRKVLFATPSARKARDMLQKGLKVEVWVDNAHADTIYSKEFKKFQPYVTQEKEYIGRKQKAAELRNKHNHGRR